MLELQSKSKSMRGNLPSVISGTPTAGAETPSVLSTLFDTVNPDEVIIDKSKKLGEGNFSKV